MPSMEEGGDVARGEALDSRFRGVSYRKKTMPRWHPHLMKNGPPGVFLAPIGC
jgi:hypothetical protein